MSNLLPLILFEETLKLLNLILDPTLINIIDLMLQLLYLLKKHLVHGLVLVKYLVLVADLALQIFNPFLHSRKCVTMGCSLLLRLDHVAHIRLLEVALVDVARGHSVLGVVCRLVGDGLDDCARERQNEPRSADSCLTQLFVADVAKYSKSFPLLFVAETELTICIDANHKGLPSLILYQKSHRRPDGHMMGTEVIDHLRHLDA